jgi:Fe-S-cluster-containing dehydrogenase component
MKYAFVIDQRKCIGCHVCTVACKAEHDVPIGVYRTWVKYIERGEFPNSRRYFLVNRCNHCDDAPCVTICPTKALYKRADGIVDFDSSRCIGCKSCMQACPYDALYIDPYSHTAAKCNYCAHRVEVGLEPACVMVCPERAIIAGDIHNPNTEIARILAREPVRVRKPEQGTGPTVYYLGADTASMADYWLPTWPGSETAVLLAMARVLLVEKLYNCEYMRRRVNWSEYMAAEHPHKPQTFDRFIELLIDMYAEYTPAFAAQESGLAEETIVDIVRQIGRAGTAFAAHTRRAACSGNLGGWQVSRALWFLSVLTGSIGTPGGTAPNSWHKFVPAPFLKPGPSQVRNELLFPPEYPVANYEMSILLPYFLKEGRGKIAGYFTRVYNPVWTNPNGISWIEALTNKQQIELHAALTPTWNETAFYADYVLLMGVGSERHDLMSQKTHAARWIGFRQPVLRVYRERHGQAVQYTYQANSREVWEEDEFWIELSWRIDPDGSLGIRKYFESPYRPGEKLTITEYYRWIFEHSVPGLPEAAAQEISCACQLRSATSLIEPGSLRASVQASSPVPITWAAGVWIPAREQTAGPLRW